MINKFFRINHETLIDTLEFKLIRNPNGDNILSYDYAPMSITKNKLFSKRYIAYAIINGELKILSFGTKMSKNIGMRVFEEDIVTKIKRKPLSYDFGYPNMIDYDVIELSCESIGDVSQMIKDFNLTLEDAIYQLKVNNVGFMNKAKISDVDGNFMLEHYMKDEMFKTRYNREKKMKIIEDIL